MSTILVLMITFAHKTTCTNLVSNYLLRIGYSTKRCSPYEQAGLLYHAQPIKEAQGKFCGRKIQKDLLTLVLVVNNDMHQQVGTCDYLEISIPRMLWIVVANTFMCNGLQSKWFG